MVNIKPLSNAPYHTNIFSKSETALLKARLQELEELVNLLELDNKYLRLRLKKSLEGKKTSYSSIPWSAEEENHSSSMPILE